MKDVNGEQSPNRLSPRWAMLAMLCTLPILVLFAYLGEIRRGETAWFCTGMIVLAIRTCWDLRKHVWFWMTVAIVILLHVPLVLFFPWTTKNYPGISLLPVGFLDYAIVYGCIKLAEKVMKRA